MCLVKSLVLQFSELLLEVSLNVLVSFVFCWVSCESFCLVLGEGNLEKGNLVILLISNQNC